MYLKIVCTCAIDDITFSRNDTRSDDLHRIYGHNFKIDVIFKLSML